MSGKGPRRSGSEPSVPARASLFRTVKQASEQRPPRDGVTRPVAVHVACNVPTRQRGHRVIPERASAPGCAWTGETLGFAEPKAGGSLSV